MLIIAAGIALEFVANEGRFFAEWIDAESADSFGFRTVEFGFYNLEFVKEGACLLICSDFSFNLFFHFIGISTIASISNISLK